MKKTDINKYSGTPVADGYHKSSAGETTVSTVKTVIFVVLKVLLTVAMIGIVTGGIVGVSMFTFIMGMSGDTVNYDLYASKLNLTSFIYVNDENGQPVMYKRVPAAEQRVWVNFEDIPTAMKDAIIAIEDKRFEEHKGVDWIRTSGAVLNLVTGGGKSGSTFGGSTLTQQLIKNLTDDSDVSLTRKVREIFRALNFEKRYSKDEILETYLNVVNFGSGCNGVQAAANLYFGKSIKDCSIAECAAIAGITQNPAAYTPLVYPENNKKRQIDVIDAMYDQGKITAEEYKQALDDAEHMVFSDAEEVDDQQNNTTVNNEYDQINNWYIDTMLLDVKKDLAEKLNIGESKAEDMILNQGLKIYSAMDKDAQEAAQSTVLDSSAMPDDPDIQVGYMMMDYDGRVLASIGQRQEKTANYLFDCANQAIRQPGSTMKAIAVYAPAIDYKRYTYSTIVPDEPLKDVLIGDDVKGDWPPNWYKNPPYYGTMTLQRALEISCNAAAAQVGNTLTWQGCFDFITQKLGITTLNAQQDVVPSLVLGSPTNGVTVREMVGAYQIFGNGGIYNEPYTYFYVTDNQGNVLLDKRDKVGTQAIKSTTSTIMRKLLEKVVTGPEGTGQACKVPGTTTFLKTGTTDENVNSWVVGGTPYAVAGIWLGYADTQTEEMTGTEAAFSKSLWRTIMTKYVQNKSALQFKDDPDVVEMDYCVKTGLIADPEKCTETAKGYYSKDNIPAKCTGVHDGDAVSSSASSSPASSGPVSSSASSGAASSQASSASSGSYSSSSKSASSNNSAQSSDKPVVASAGNTTSASE